MSSFEALGKAKDQGLDLVEIHDKSDPPICKIMDYGKWKFDTKKKEKLNRKNQTKVSTKEIQLRPRTDEGDIQIKLGKAREFLKQGYKVKVNLRFFGREMVHKNLGFDLLKRMEKLLSDLSQVDQEPKMERRSLYLILSPSSAGGKKPAPKKEEEKKAEEKPSKEEK